ncbi:hypothetical protein [Sporosarcina sp. FSL W7-1283]|uniref:hypothetical protein n=1 Tax=Sporosarcina sp. FSL W7-1283 TaxID=2921560 RepID=UPI0030FA4F8F
MLKLLIMLFCLFIALRLLFKKRQIILGLSVKQVFLSLVAYLVAVLIGTVCIYYIGNWIAKSFASPFLQYAVFILIIIVTFAFVQPLLHKAVNRITDGKLFSD